MSIEKTKSFLYLEREYDIGDIVLTVIMDTGFFYTDRLTYEPHMHMEHEVHIPISGEYSVELAESGDVFSIKRGDILVIPPNTYHNTMADTLVRGNDGTVPRKFSFTMRSRQNLSSDPHAERLWDSLSGILQQKGRQASVLYMPEAVRILESIQKELSGTATGKTVMADALMQQFLVKYLRLVLEEKDNPGEQSEYEDVVRNIRKNTKEDSSGARERQISIFLDKHYFLPEISEAMAADELHISVRQLSRLFDQYYHMTFRQKLTEVRLNHACRLLTRTEMSAQDIAYRVGYQSSSVFFVSFRKRYHMTPGEFRKNTQKIQ